MDTHQSMQRWVIAMDDDWFRYYDDDDDDDDDDGSKLDSKFDDFRWSTTSWDLFNQISLSFEITRCGRSEGSRAI